MARNTDVTEDVFKEEQKRIKEEKKLLKAERKKQKQEAKARAKEISEQEAELNDEPGGIPVFLVTIVIVLVWLAILCVLVKLDVGGVGSNVLKPLLKDVPIVNQILPGDGFGNASPEDVDPEDPYSKYTSIEQAVDQIKLLESQLEEAQNGSLEKDEKIRLLQEENMSLSSLEADKLAFEKEKESFYEEVVYAEKGPGKEEYKKYYESIDPTAAENLYRQVVQEATADEQIQGYADAYAAMKPKDAAAVFDTMTNDLNLVAKILGAMGSDDRGNILGQMKEENAARVTKIMDPDTGFVYRK